jgi:HK97 family phage portal protein
MGILAEMRESIALRASSLEDPAITLNSGRLAQIIGGEPSLTGVPVTPQKAITYVAMMKCARVKAESLAQLPVGVFERLEQGRRKAYEHPLHRLLARKPNPEMNSFCFREISSYHLDFFGNFYAERELNGAGETIALWPLRPDRTKAERRMGERIYRTVVKDGSSERAVGLPASRVFHIPGPGFDGMNGMNPLVILRQAVGLGLAMEEYAARLFSNGAMPNILLQFPAGSRISPEARTALVERFDMLQQGLSKAHRTASLEEGITIDKLSFNPEESQLLGSRLYQERQIASFMRVQPHMVGDLERATFSNIEHQGIEYVQYSLGPNIARWEYACDDLFQEDEQGSYYCRFNVDGLLRGDFASRVIGQVAQVQNGLRNPNEIREQDELNPREDGLGDRYMIPANFLFAESAAAEPDADAGRRNALRKKDPANPAAWVVRERYRANYAILYRAIYEDLARTEAAAVGRLLDRAETEGLAAINDKLVAFYEGFEVKAATRLTPTLRGLADLLAPTIVGKPGLSERAEEIALAGARRLAHERMAALVKSAGEPGSPVDNMRGVVGSFEPSAEAEAALDQAIETLVAAGMAAGRG